MTYPYTKYKRELSSTMVYIDLLRTWLSVRDNLLEVKTGKKISASFFLDIMQCRCAIINMLKNHAGRMWGCWSKTADGSSRSRCSAIRPESISVGHHIMTRCACLSL